MKPAYWILVITGSVCTAGFWGQWLVHNNLSSLYPAIIFGTFTTVLTVLGLIRGRPAPVENKPESGIGLTASELVVEFEEKVRASELYNISQLKVKDEILAAHKRNEFSAVMYIDRNCAIVIQKSMRGSGFSTLIEKVDSPDERNRVCFHVNWPKPQ